MSVFTLFSRRDSAPILKDGRILLRAPRRTDYDEWRALRVASQDFLKPWEPTWHPSDLTRLGYIERIARYEREREAGQTLAFFLFERGSGALAGGVTASNIRRGAAQSCMLGYWMGERFAGQGLMLHGLNTLIPYLFHEVRLHRIEAACIPQNNRSARLLEKAGFRQEGYLKGYLKINGAWRDHILFALLADEYPPVRPIGIARGSGQ